MADQNGKSRDTITKKTKRLIALTGNSHSPFSVASDLVSSPARDSQQAPSSQNKSDPRKTPASQKKAGSGDFSPNDSRGGKTPLSLDEQGISSLDEAVGPSAEKQAIRRDPAPVSDESLLMHPSESSACDETACEASLGIDALEAVTFASVYNASLGLLASREHSAGELRVKLKQKYPDGEIHLDGVLERLQEVGLQDDERFAEMFVRYKANKGQGPTKIRHQLRSKSVDGTVISAALSDPSYDWSELAKAVSQKKFGASGGERLSPKERARRQRFLQGRGFGYEHIASAL